MRQYLIVANLTLGRAELWREVRERMTAGPCRFHVLAPAAHEPRSGAYTEVQNEGEAAQRVEHMLARLHEMGAEATSEIGDIRPFDAVLDTIERDGPIYDEILLSTLPASVSKWLGLDLVSKLRRNLDIPITHVIGATEPAET
ncbi:hypothetical protein ER308_09275 [Egibacter rhizosphaerae]|uniref:Universal stress protein n=1 Tax=Egibacter rhizosphaerae TaxID=1670831 RepID=A0A411YEU2_9ACTN|nr:hypothetical protein [Egibacter rhizosphaerae]QBI19720.1 hypothetical protein ER308_09275 [Egibacter rhizosphaerae]